jgi:hypothetical protein
VQIFFDESGDFNTAITADYKFAFVVGIILPDSAVARLKNWLERSKPATAKR